MIYRIALNDTHSPTDAEDILQEVLLSLFTAAPAFENREHEKRWIIRVTLNKGKNHRRFFLRHPVLALEEADRCYIAQEPEHHTLREAVAMLPRNWRRAIDLYYYEGFSAGEIADLMHTKESTVRTWLHRGRKKLRESLLEEV